MADEGVSRSIGAHRVVYYCRLSLCERTMRRAFRSAKGDTCFSDDAEPLTAGPRLVPGIGDQYVVLIAGYYLSGTFLSGFKRFTICVRLLLSVQCGDQFSDGSADFKVSNNAFAACRWVNAARPDNADVNSAWAISSRPRSW